MRTTITVQTNNEDIDQLGHVNNCRYFSFLEAGRLDWYSQCGISLTEMLERNLGTVVLKIDILFKKESKLGDTLKIVTCLNQLGTTSFVLNQDIYNQFDEHITEAKVKSVMFDPSLRKSIKVIDEIAQNFQG
jgi:YbgC/YbaW family acyl-CoA thioester hydrolase